MKQLNSGWGPFVALSVGLIVVGAGCASKTSDVAPGIADTKAGAIDPAQSQADAPPAPPTPPRKGPRFLLEVPNVPPKAPDPGVRGIAVPNFVQEPFVAPPVGGLKPVPSGIHLPAQDQPLRVAPPRPSAQSPRGSAPIGTEGEAPLAPANDFDSINYVDNAAENGGFSFIPPDPHGAAGPNHVVSVVNTVVRFHTKAGAQTYQDSLQDFFTVLSPATATFDPKVLYDQFSDRWVVVTLEVEDPGNTATGDTSFLFVGVSDDSDPNGDWCMTSIDTKLNIASNLYWLDYPGLAVDEEAIYLTGNMFTLFDDGTGTDGNAGGHTRIWVFDKGQTPNGLYNCTAPAAVTATVSLMDPYASNGGVSTTTQPAHIYGTAPTGVGTWLVSYSGLSDGTNEFLQVFRLDDPLGTPSFSTAEFLNLGDITAGGGLPDAAQSGTAFTIETNDPRALDAVWRNNALYTVASYVPSAGTDSGQTTAILWDLDTTTLGSTSVTASTEFGAEDVATGAYTFFPSVAVNRYDDVVVGFSVSDDSIFPSAYYARRQGTAPSPAFGGSQLVKAGVDYYHRTFGGGSNRWGDYTAASVDPSDDCFWVYNEWADTRSSGATSENGRWGTTFAYDCVTHFADGFESGNVSVWSATVP